MKAISYGRQSIDRKDIESIVEVLRSDFLTQGPMVEKFEQSVARFCGAKYAVAVNSGTAALHAAMFAIGLKPGDEVITTPLSFAATANCILYFGATPVLADVEYETGLLDPVEVEKKITKKTKAIITVDYSGHPSYYQELKAIAKRHHLILVSDAAHSFGAQYQGESIGAQADITTFSFHPVKIITTGEGGMVVTNNRTFYERAFLFRTHGITKDPNKFIFKEHQQKPWYYEMQELGFNYRLTDFQCALGISQLARVHKFIDKRRSIAAFYTKAFNGDRRFKVFREQPDCQSSWHFYPLRIVGSKLNKIDLFHFLRKNGIYPQVHYIPIHLQPYYRKRFGYKHESFPKAEQFYQEEISLPIFYDLTKIQMEKVVRTLSRFFLNKPSKNEIQVRRVRAPDREAILGLRNDDSVRVNFRNIEKVSLSKHISWFKQQMSSGEMRKRFLVAVESGQVIGYIRYDLIVKDQSFHVSIAVQRKYRHQGVGSKLLKASLPLIVRKGKPIIAEVKKSNIPSAQFFTEHGFVPYKQIADYLSLIYQ